MRKRFCDKCEAEITAYNTSNQTFCGKTNTIKGVEHVHFCFYCNTFHDICMDCIFNILTDIRKEYKVGKTKKKEKRWGGK